MNLSKLHIDDKYMVQSTYMYVCTVYTVYLANIKFSKLECNANWQIKSLVNGTIMSVDCFIMYVNIISVGIDWSQSCQTVKLKSPPNLPHIHYVCMVRLSVYDKIQWTNHSSFCEQTVNRNFIIRNMQLIICDNKWWTERWMK